MRLEEKRNIPEVNTATFNCKLIYREQPIQNVSYCSAVLMLLDALAMHSFESKFPGQGLCGSAIGETLLFIGSRWSVQKAVSLAASAAQRTPLQVIAFDWQDFSSALEDSQPSLLVVDLGGSAGIEERIELLSSALEAIPGAMVIVVCDDVSPSRLRQIARLGVAGLLGSDVGTVVLTRAFDLVLLGHQILPAGTLARLLEPSAASIGGAHAAMPALGRIPANASWAIRLSEREDEILSLLMRGESNKKIALNLNISDATVKVHVKALLRKLRVSNRTQAATWGLARGRLREADLRVQAPS